MAAVGALSLEHVWSANQGDGDEYAQQKDRSDPPRLRGQQERKVTFHIDKGCLFSCMAAAYSRFRVPHLAARWLFQGLGAINGVGRVLGLRMIRHRQLHRVACFGWPHKYA
jgi:hypothetical protein